jgi:hypothetical protein
MWYCYTDRRLIVRSGAVGVDFQSLYYKDITQTDVRVGFLDKKHGTGSICFRSPAAHCRPITFAHVHQPYDVLRRVKEYMDTKR